MNVVICKSLDIKLIDFCQEQWGLAYYSLFGTHPTTFLSSRKIAPPQHLELLRTAFSYLFTLQSQWPLHDGFSPFSSKSRPYLLLPLVKLDLSVSYLFGCVHFLRSSHCWPRYAATQLSSIHGVARHRSLSKGWTKIDGNLGFRSDSRDEVSGFMKIRWIVVQPNAYM